MVAERKGVSRLVI